MEGGVKNMDRKFETGASRAGFKEKKVAGPKSPLDRVVQAQEAWFGKTGVDEKWKFNGRNFVEEKPT